MNDAINPTLPFDSLGRKLGIATGFSTYTAQMLECMKDDLGLFMSVWDLTALKNYYRNAKYKNISLSELYFFDSLLKNAHSRHISTAITNLITDDGDIISTYNDMISKRYYVKGNIASPMSLSEASRISSDYMNKIGIKPKDVSSEALRRFSLTDGGEVFPKLYSPSKKILPINTSFLIVTPTDSCPDYNAQFNAFSKSAVFEQFVDAAVKVDERGIAFALSCFADGIFGDLYSIPGINYPSEISALASEHVGSFIIALDKIFIPTLTETASEYGLELTYFAKSVATKKFELLNKCNVSMSVDTELIRNLGNTLCGSDFVIESQNETDDTVLCSDILFSSSDAKSTIKYGDQVYCDGKLFSVSCTDNISNKGFIDGINAVITTALPLIASGVKPNEVSMKLRYTFSGLDSDTGRGKALSLILGVYRALMELCIRDSAELDYSDGEENKLSCAACVDTPMKSTTPRFKQVGNAIYLLSFDRTENGLPDFSSFRRMCEFLNQLISAEKVVSVCAINGKICDTVRLMSGLFDFSEDSASPNILDSDATGFIVEAPFPLSTGVLLGSVTQAIEQTV